MPKGIKGFQKGHKVFGGKSTRFPKGYLGGHKYQKGHISVNKGVPCSEEQKMKASITSKGKHYSIATEFKKGHIPPSNPELTRKKLMKHPMSSLEKRFNYFIKKLDLPYKFVGNGDFIIENKCPDFINTNGEKIAIEVYFTKHKEMFGAAKETGIKKWKFNRLKLFNKYGWDVKFFNEKEISEENIKNILIGY